LGLNSRKVYETANPHIPILGHFNHKRELLVLRLVKKSWTGWGVRTALYLTIPVLVFLSQADRSLWLTGRMEMVFNLFFGVMVFFSVMTLRLTRRQKGFTATPVDFLILLIALVVPNLPGVSVTNFNLGLLAVKIIVLLFGFEVLMGESRGRYDRVWWTVTAALLVMALR